MGSPLPTILEVNRGPSIGVGSVDTLQYVDFQSQVRYDS